MTSGTHAQMPETTERERLRGRHRSPGVGATETAAELSAAAAAALCRIDLPPQRYPPLAGTVPVAESPQRA